VPVCGTKFGDLVIGAIGEGRCDADVAWDNGDLVTICCSVGVPSDFADIESGRRPPYFPVGKRFIPGDVTEVTPEPVTLVGPKFGLPVFAVNSTCTSMPLH
jgi:hypothetical protein